MRYIYISDQGRIFSSEDEPTLEDLEYARVGMLTILRLADNCSYQTDGKWRAVQPGKRVRAEVEGQQTAEFHSDASNPETPWNRVSDRNEFRVGAGPTRNLPVLAASFTPLEALRRDSVHAVAEKPR